MYKIIFSLCVRSLTAEPGLVLFLTLLAVTGLVQPSLPKRISRHDTNNGTHCHQLLSLLGLLLRFNRPDGIISLLRRIMKGSQEVKGH